MSPELLEHARRGKQSPYDPRAVDVWASGVMLVIMMFGSKPFSHDRTEDKEFASAEEALW